MCTVDIFLQKKYIHILIDMNVCDNQESVAGSVIQATGTMELEDGLRTGREAAGALRAAAPSLGSIPISPGGVIWSWGQYSCHRDSLVRPNSSSAEFCASVVLNHSCYVVLGLNWS